MGMLEKRIGAFDGVNAFLLRRKSVVYMQWPDG